MYMYIRHGSFYRCWVFSSGDRTIGRRLACRPAIQNTSSSITPCSVRNSVFADTLLVASLLLSPPLIALTWKKALEWGFKSMNFRTLSQWRIWFWSLINLCSNVVIFLVRNQHNTKNIFCIHPARRCPVHSSDEQRPRYIERDFASIVPPVVLLRLVHRSSYFGDVALLVLSLIRVASERLNQRFLVVGGIPEKKHNKSRVVWSRRYLVD